MLYGCRRLKVVKQRLELRKLYLAAATGRQGATSMIAEGGGSGVPGEWERVVSGRERLR